jgi:soluble lytic murein transglycosylase
MQLMPKTAHYVARKIGLTAYTHSDIDSAETNILLGVNYLNIILHRFDDSWLLASAAYNAGPSRVKRWRAALQKDVDGAIFAETIPFDETRTYVKNVLANATLYSALLTGQPQSLQHRLGEISSAQQTSDDEIP